MGQPGMSASGQPGSSMCPEADPSHQVETLVCGFDWMVPRDRAMVYMERPARWPFLHPRTGDLYSRHGEVQVHDPTLPPA